MEAAPAPNYSVAKLRGFGKRNGHGFGVAVVVAVAAQFLSEHYGAPAMLMALLLGIAFHFLSEDGVCKPGIEFSARSVLRFGIALLGARISFEMIIALGPMMIVLIVAGVILTLLSGLLGAKFLKRGWRFGLLTGGSVAICGASAAMAISAVLPKNEHSERNLIFTVLSVTVLSTLAMIIYPVLTKVFGFDNFTSGVFLGGTIHDVAQVVGAGFSVSDQTGEVATLVKLIRVSMLAPVVLIISLSVRRYSIGNDPLASTPPLLPFFVVAFLTFGTLNSLGLIPQYATEYIDRISRWALLISIAAVGMKTSLKRVLDVGGQAVILIVAETVFVAAFVLFGVKLLGH
jgi:uncharacterized integral membrane protein (TIGR00698 family)